MAHAAPELYPASQRQARLGAVDRRQCDPSLIDELLKIIDCPHRIPYTAAGQNSAGFQVAGDGHDPILILR